MTLKELIKGNFVYFDSLRQGFAYYKLYNSFIGLEDPQYYGKKAEEVPKYVSDRFLKLEVYLFTIPLEDIGNGTLRLKMRAIECMRWIRKAMESNELIKIV